MKLEIVGRKFYERRALKVAQNLLGCVIVRRVGRKTLRAVITDVEAYVGEDDLACHASKGRTPRTETLYGKPGQAYVYMIYGMHYIFNVVAEKEGYPAGIMIRAVFMEGLPREKTNGPGRVSKILHIDQSCNGLDLTLGKKMWIEKGDRIAKKDILTLKRVGIDYAQHCAEYLWRFQIARSK